MIKSDSDACVISIIFNKKEDVIKNNESFFCYKKLTPFDAFENQNNKIN